MVSQRELKIIIVHVFLYRVLTAQIRARKPLSVGVDLTARVDEFDTKHDEALISTARSGTHLS
jgi:hypothetical protein